MKYFDKQISRSNFRWTAANREKVTDRQSSSMPPHVLTQQIPIKLPSALCKEGRINEQIAVTTNTCVSVHPLTGWIGKMRCVCVCVCICRQLNERGWGQTGKHYSDAEECNSSKGILGKIATDRKVGSCSWKVEPQVRSLSGSQTQRKKIILQAAKRRDNHCSCNDADQKEKVR